MLYFGFSVTVVLAVMIARKAGLITFAVGMTVIVRWSTNLSF